MRIDGSGACGGSEGGGVDERRQSEVGRLLLGGGAAMLWLYCSVGLNRAVVGVIVDVFLGELIMMGPSWTGEMQDPLMIQREMLSRVS